MMPVKGEANLSFGHQADFLVAIKESPKFLFYYKMKNASFQLVWKKPIPDHDYNCRKYISPAGHIFLQSYSHKVILYDNNLKRIKKLRTPGTMIGLISDKLAIVDNHFSPSVKRDGFRLSVSKASDLHSVHHTLEVPTDGAYSAADELHACGQEDGRVAVTAHGKSFVDFYTNKGE